jgi:uncharacterized protein YjgD (DUF1641 family)
MALPIPKAPPPRDPRLILQARLQQAPVEHAEALLSGYEVLQGLHDRGVLDMLRGALGSSDEVLEIAVDMAKSPESIRSIRNLLLLVKMLGAIDPEQLKVLTTVVPEALQSITKHPEPPSLWTLLKQMLWNTDMRRGLSALNSMLQTFGRKLAKDRH